MKIRRWRNNTFTDQLTLITYVLGMRSDDYWLWWVQDWGQFKRVMVDQVFLIPGP